MVNEHIINYNNYKMHHHQCNLHYLEYKYIINYGNYQMKIFQ